VTILYISCLSCGEDNGCILILGSDGVIGRAIALQLAGSGETICEVHGRMDLDLRIPGALKSHFAEKRVTYVIFLAFEVGGSKYLSASGNAQIQLQQYNQMIYKEVFSFLDQKNVPFMFISSQMVLASKSTYGQMKLLGEELTLSRPLGVVVRLWNVIGWESPGMKAHVFVDWIDACLENHEVRSLSNGLEQRQFIHATDAAQFLITLMHHHYEEGLSSIPGPRGRERIIDVSSGTWHTMRAAARHLERIFNAINHPCKIEFRKDAPQSQSSICIQPNLTMPHGILSSSRSPFTASLQEGLKLILEEALMYHTKDLDRKKKIALIVMFDCQNGGQSAVEFGWKKFAVAQEMWGTCGDYDMFLVPHGCNCSELSASLCSQLKRKHGVHVLTIPECEEEESRLSPGCIVGTSRKIQKEWNIPWLLFTSEHTYYPKAVYLEANPEKTKSFPWNAVFTLADRIVKPCHQDNAVGMDARLIQSFHSRCESLSFTPSYDTIECISAKMFEEFVIIPADKLSGSTVNRNHIASSEPNTLCFEAPVRRSPMFFLSQSCNDDT
jgi:nucleoside-diphosphate-sugar epimerase